MSSFVLDAFALLAFFKNEPGRARVEMLLRRANDSLDSVHVAVVNLGEMYYKLRHNVGTVAADRSLMRVNQMPIEVVEIDWRLARQAAYAKAERRLGYMDCFAYALARRLDAAVVTGDDDFKVVEDLVAIEWLPQPGRG